MHDGLILNSVSDVWYFKGGPRKKKIAMEIEHHSRNLLGPRQCNSGVFQNHVLGKGSLADVSDWCTVHPFSANP